MSWGKDDYLYRAYLAIAPIAEAIRIKIYIQFNMMIEKSQF